MEEEQQEQIQQKILKITLITCQNVFSQSCIDSAYFTINYNKDQQTSIEIQQKTITLESPFYFKLEPNQNLVQIILYNRYQKQSDLQVSEYNFDLENMPNKDKENQFFPMTSSKDSYNICFLRYKIEIFQSVFIQNPGCCLSINPADLPFDSRNAYFILKHQGRNYEIYLHTKETVIDIFTNNPLDYFTLFYYKFKKAIPVRMTFIKQNFAKQNLNKHKHCRKENIYKPLSVISLNRFLRIPIFKIINNIRIIQYRIICIKINCTITQKQEFGIIFKQKKMLFSPKDIQINTFLNHLSVQDGKYIFRISEKYNRIPELISEFNIGQHEFTISLNFDILCDQSYQFLFELYDCQLLGNNKQIFPLYYFELDAQYLTDKSKIELAYEGKMTQKYVELLYQYFLKTDKLLQEYLKQPVKFRLRYNVKTSNFIENPYGKLEIQYVQIKDLTQRLNFSQLQIRPNIVLKCNNQTFKYNESIISVIYKYQSRNPEFQRKVEFTTRSIMDIISIELHNDQNHKKEKLVVAQFMISDLIGFDNNIKKFEIGDYNKNLSGQLSFNCEYIPDNLHYKHQLKLSNNQNHGLVLNENQLPNEEQKKAIYKFDRLPIYQRRLEADEDVQDELKKLSQNNKGVKSVYQLKIKNYKLIGIPNINNNKFQLHFKTDKQNFFTMKKFYNDSFFSESFNFVDTEQFKDLSIKLLFFKSEVIEKSCISEVYLGTLFIKQIPLTYNQTFYKNLILINENKQRIILQLKMVIKRLPQFKPCLLEINPLFTFDIVLDHLYDLSEFQGQKDVDYKWKRSGVYLLSIQLQDFDHSNLPQEKLVNGTVLPVNSHQNEPHIYTKTFVKKYWFHNMLNLYQFQKVTEYSKNYTILFENQPYYFIINHPTANLLFQIFYVKDDQKQLIYQKKQNFLEISRNNEKYLYSVTLNPAAEFEKHFKDKYIQTRDCVLSEQQTCLFYKSKIIDVKENIDEKQILSQKDEKFQLQNFTPSFKVLQFNIIKFNNISINFDEFTQILGHSFSINQGYIDKKCILKSKVPLSHNQVDQMQSIFQSQKFFCSFYNILQMKYNYQDIITFTNQILCDQSQKNLINDDPIILHKLKLIKKKLNITKLNLKDNQELQIYSKIKLNNFEYGNLHMKIKMSQPKFQEASDQVKLRLSQFTLRGIENPEDLKLFNIKVFTDKTQFLYLNFNHYYMDKQNYVFDKILVYLISQILQNMMYNSYVYIKIVNNFQQKTLLGQQLFQLNFQYNIKTPQKQQFLLYNYIQSSKDKNAKTLYSFVFEFYITIEDIEIISTTYTKSQINSVINIIKKMKQQHNKLIYRNEELQVNNFEIQSLRNCFKFHQTQFSQILAKKSKRLGKFMVQKLMLKQQNLNKSLSDNLSQQDFRHYIMFSFEKKKNFTLKYDLDYQEITLNFLDQTKIIKKDNYEIVRHQTYVSIFLKERICMYFLQRDIQLLDTFFVEFLYTDKLGRNQQESGSFSQNFEDLTQGTKIFTQVVLNPSLQIICFQTPSIRSDLKSIRNSQIFKIVSLTYHQVVKLDTKQLRQTLLSQELYQYMETQVFNQFQIIQIPELPNLSQFFQINLEAFYDNQVSPSVDLLTNGVANKFNPHIVEFFSNEIDPQIDIYLKASNISSTLSDSVDMKIGKCTINVAQCLLEDGQNHYFVLPFQNTTYQKNDVIKMIQEKYDMQNIFLLGSLNFKQVPWYIIKLKANKFILQAQENCVYKLEFQVFIKLNTEQVELRQIFQYQTGFYAVENDLIDFENNEYFDFRFVNNDLKLFLKIILYSKQNEKITKLSQRIYYLNDFLDEMANKIIDIYFQRIDYGDDIIPFLNLNINVHNRLDGENADFQKRKGFTQLTSREKMLQHCEKILNETDPQQFINKIIQMKVDIIFHKLELSFIIEIIKFYCEIIYFFKDNTNILLECFRTLLNIIFQADLKHCQNPNNIEQDYRFHFTQLIKEIIFIMTPIEEITKHFINQKEVAIILNTSSTNERKQVHINSLDLNLIKKTLNDNFQFKQNSDTTSHFKNNHEIFNNLLLLILGILDYIQPDERFINVFKNILQFCQDHGFNSDRLKVQFSLLIDEICGLQYDSKLIFQYCSWAIKIEIADLEGVDLQKKSEQMQKLLNPVSNIIGLTCRNEKNIEIIKINLRFLLVQLHLFIQINNEFYTKIIKIIYQKLEQIFSIREFVLEFRHIIIDEFKILNYIEMVLYDKETSNEFFQDCINIIIFIVEKLKVFTDEIKKINYHLNIQLKSQPNNVKQEALNIFQIYIDQKIQNLKIIEKAKIQKRMNFKDENEIRQRYQISKLNWM